MSENIQYILNEKGERVGVLLDIQAYQKLVNPLISDPECLINLSLDELQALAKSKLAPTSQSRLDELLTQNAESQLPHDLVIELDNLLAQVDHLTILRTRAIYTLNRLQNLAAAS
jgi:hypothetical protein